ncbi:hypothetical protein BAY61_15350 [Prauserella marina]|uniref:Uncharacterized protein n=1 Tax=Prauserella marina TaxID=530584 RepID=A0A222VQM6_9PSEU|nr:hypothetical protein [Prauserella marina]ASR36152.1 hypothetical protein BAY61_15350 [Prauserella marina]PWV76898.1 hypothetical protein DES30_105115 [Prauserella marina]SDC99965.1 hypothetical protein SAMN05421630_105116 [Prauserella marina]
MHKGRITFAAAIAAVALGLSACGSEEEGTPAAGEPTTAASSAEAEAPESSEADVPADSEDSPSAEDVTAPGTELKTGETAVLPFTYGTDKSGTIGVTVTDIEQGDSADLAEFGDRAKGLVPYYVKISVENLEGTDLAYSSVSLRAVTGDGRGTGVVISGDVEGKCESDSAPREFTSAGATYETCVLQAAQEGVDVVGAEFDDGDAYQDEPVTWVK